MEPWITPPDMATTSCSGVDPVDLEGPIALASTILYLLTGQRWPGEQDDVIRPCSPLRTLGVDPGSTYGLAGWGWTARSGWCGCGSPSICGCDTAGLVELPGFPTVGVDTVTLDGVVLDPASYRLMGQLLVRVDGRWPCCQDWTVPGDQPGAFEVRYRWGALPDDAGLYACAVLACELWKGSQGEASCRLPKRVTTVTRQGVTIAMLDPLSLFPDGMTGVPEVDLWLGAQRYGDVHRPSTVMVPGQRQRSMRDS